MSLVYSVGKKVDEKEHEAGINVPICSQGTCAKGTTEFRKVTGPCPSSGQYMRISRNFSSSDLANSWCDVIKFLLEAPIGDVEEYLKRRK